MQYTDLQILNLLQKDSRLPSTEIARLIGAVSPQLVRYRIKRLIQSGIIRFVAIIEPRALGLLVTGDVFVEIRPNCAVEMGHRLMECDLVSYVGYSLTDQHVGFTIHTHNNEELFEFVTQVVGNLPGVIKTNTVVVPLLVKHVADWNIPDHKVADVSITNNVAASSMNTFPCDIDQIDRSIIRILQENARFSGEDIARILKNIPGHVIRYRIDRLIEKGVIRPRAIICPEAEGYKVTGEIFIEVEPGKIINVGRKVAEIMEVSYVACSIGEKDLSVQIYGRDENEITNLVDDVIKYIPGITNISKVHFIQVLKGIYDWKIPNSIIME